MDESVDKGNEKTKNNTLFESIRTYISKLSPKLKMKIILLLIILAVIIVCYNNFFVEQEVNDDDAQSETTTNRYSYYVSSLDYCNEMEQKLKKVLSNLDGIGNVEVMITLDSSMELVFASGNEDKDSNSIFTSDSDSYYVEVSSPVIIENNGKEEPLIVKEILPKVNGVLVVCSGIENVSQKLDIIYAVQSLLSIDISNIQVLSKS